MVKKTVEYVETRTAGVDSKIDCGRCKQRVEWVTFMADGENIGVCACRWTSWFKDAFGKVYRSSVGAGG